MVTKPLFHTRPPLLPHNPAPLPAPPHFTSPPPIFPPSPAPPTHTLPHPDISPVPPPQSLKMFKDNCYELNI